VHYGDFTEHDYHFEIDGALVASVHKKWVTLRNQIEIIIAGEVDHRLIISTVIVIEHIEAIERQKQH
jgi:uncharacterized protein YxjI